MKESTARAALNRSANRLRVNARNAKGTAQYKQLRRAALAERDALNSFGEDDD